MKNYQASLVEMQKDKWTGENTYISESDQINRKLDEIIKLLKQQNKDVKNKIEYENNFRY
jgi:hypothetical protein